MNVVEFTKELSAQGVELWRDGDRLRYRAPKEVLTPTLLTKIKHHKADILKLLSEGAKTFPLSQSVTTAFQSDLYLQVPPLKPVQHQAKMPLSFAQQRLWFLDLLEPGLSAYNITFIRSLNGSLNIPVLEKCLNEIVRRHEVLRTFFTTIDGQPVQKIYQTAKLPLPAVDLRTWSESEREEQARRLMAEEAEHSFDLSCDLLIRAKLFIMEEQKYYFVLTMHHIVSDGWSISIFEKELAVLYMAFLNEEPSHLPELPIQYVDFSVWQRNWLQGEILDKQLSYWKQQLDGTPPLLELPTDYPRPTAQTFHGANQYFSLPEGLSSSINELSSHEGVTPFMFMLAAFQVLLHRYTGQNDIVVGSPIANRTREEIEHLIGFFVNTLVLRGDLSDNPTFRDLLQRIREVAIGAYTHQDLPFEKLVEELQPERNLSHSPLFQVLFAYINVPLVDLELGDLTLSPLQVDSKIAKFDLSFFWAGTDKGIKGVVEYNTDLFNRDTIRRMLGHFQILLESITKNPECSISTLPILTMAEQDQLILEWNDTKKDYPENKCIHQLFESQVERTPYAVALVYEDEQLTYLELNERSNQLAHYLQALGVGPEVLVGICVERSIEMIVGVLGILKTGGAYVPLDPSYPKERLKFMIDDSNSEILLTIKNLLEYLPEKNIKKFCLDNEWNVVSEYRTENLSNLPNVRNLAYVIYTSGSTGKPKGVALEHEAVVNQMYWMQDQFKLNSNDLILQKTPYSFDVSVSELFFPLMFGSRLLLARPEGHKDPAYLIKLIQEHNVTMLQFVPSMLQIFLESIGVEKCVSIRWVICAGEALSYDLKYRFFSIFNARLINLYGPTEAAIYASYWDCSKGLPQKVVPIGYPISNYKLYILDKFLQPVPIGVSGELFIGGVGLARGYINRPDLTAERFIDNPFFKDSNERLYRTGDMACYLSDGAIKFLGRTDHQVKVRGFRVELGEIESFLAQHPCVREAVVLAREDEPGNKRLVAYIVPEEDSKPSTSGLRDFLKKKLPEYMIPSVFMMLGSIPLTPNGKVDRKALPTPDQKRPEMDKEFVAPGTPTEIKLAEIWGRLLKLKEVGVNDNFFELGGHSLLAVKLFAQMERIIGKKIPLATLFQAPTIKQLADILRQKEWRPDWSSLVAIQPGGSKPPLFLIHGASGNIILYRSLARHLGADQPVYGLQSQGLNGKGSYHTRLKDMAAHYIKEIRSLRPEGPYYLGGYCMGGKLAFEMAQQLHAQGQKVAMLAMFETNNSSLNSRNRSFHNKVYRSIQYIQFHGETLLRLRNKERVTFIMEKAELMKSKIEIRTNMLFSKIANTLKSGNRTTYPHVSLTKVNDQAAWDYIPRAYPGRVTLFQSKRRYAGIKDPQSGWGSLAEGGLDIIELPVYPRTMMAEPFVQVLADKLKECIHEASKEN